MSPGKSATGTVFLTVREVAERLQVGTSTVYELVRAGDLCALRFSVNPTRDRQTSRTRPIVRIAADEIDKFIRTHTSGARRA